MRNIPRETTAEKERTIPISFQLLFSEVIAEEYIIVLAKITRNPFTRTAPSPLLEANKRPAIINADQIKLMPAAKEIVISFLPIAIS